MYKYINMLNAIFSGGLWQFPVAELSLLKCQRSYWAGDQLLNQ